MSLLNLRDTTAALWKVLRDDMSATSDEQWAHIFTVMMVADLDVLEEDHDAFTNNPIRSYFYKLFTDLWILKQRPTVQLSKQNNKNKEKQITCSAFQDDWNGIYLTQMLYYNVLNYM